MRIVVEPMTFELAEVTIAPSWWRRWFLRERVEVRFAVRTKIGRWIWDDNWKSLVLDPRIEDALDRARLEALRISRSSSGVEPPS